MNSFHELDGYRFDPPITLEHNIKVNSALDVVMGAFAQQMEADGTPPIIRTVYAKGIEGLISDAMARSGQLGADAMNEALTSHEVSYVE